MSTKMAKTIVVEVSRRVPHPIYKRIVTRRKKFYAHDEEATAKLGDTVRIVEHRPLSKLKRWAWAISCVVQFRWASSPSRLTAAEASTGARGKAKK